MVNAGEPIKCPEFIARVLREWESRADDFDEYQLGARLETEAQPHKPLAESDRRALIAECFAFEASPARPGTKGEWGAHFGPFMASVAEDGTYLISRPDIRVVDLAMIAYWEERCRDTPHPVLKARYADILWDVRKTIGGNRPHIDDARVAIDAYVATAQLKSQQHAMRRIRRIERALQLAISIGDHMRIAAVRDAMFTLHEDVKCQDGVGIWTFLFDDLYENERVPLTSEQQNYMVSTLEDALKRVTNPDEPAQLDPNAGRDIAHRLAKHYQKLGKQEEAQRVIRTYGVAFERLAEGVAGILAVGWLDRVHKDYQQFGMKADADRVRLLSRRKGEQAAGEMKTITVPVEFDRKQIDDAMEELMAGTVEDALQQLVLTFVPRVEDAKEILDNLSRNSFLAQIGHSILGDGHTIAEVGPVDSDLDGNIVVQLGNDIDFASPILGEAINRIRARFGLTTDGLLDYSRRSIFFDPARVALLRHGLDAYMSGNHVTAVHVLVPQIEHILRRLLAWLNVPVNKPMNSVKGVMQEKSLTDILEREPAIQSFFEEISGSNCLQYLRVYLTDPRGHNLRNRLSHGLIGPGGFNRELSDRVIHILLMLALIGRVDDDGENTRSDERADAADISDNDASAEGCGS